MRTFFGLELPADITLQIADWRDRQFGPGGRPVPPANFHITLAFIGDIAPDSLEMLGEGVDNWLGQSDVLGAEIALNRIGYWPKPGIYWLGPDTWPEPLSYLADKLRRLATTAGARRDRNTFQPHVTLFRNCETAPAAPLTMPAIMLRYLHFTLFESRRGKTGSRYYPLQHWELPPGDF